jgi:hypothetical protein
MTRRKDQLVRRTYQDLFSAGGKDALDALGEYCKMREAKKNPEIFHSPHHGWIIKAARSHDDADQ